MKTEIEHLKLRRFELIKEIPFFSPKNGSIFTEYENGATYKDYFITIKEIEKYSEYFRELKWFENRDISEMPKYLKDKEGRYISVASWNNYQLWFKSDNFTPISEAEFRENTRKKWPPKIGDEVWTITLNKNNSYSFKKIKIIEKNKKKYIVDGGFPRNYHEISRTRKGLIKKLIKNGKSIK